MSSWSMSSSRADLGPWAEAAHAFGLDHPALLRSPGARKIAEEAHRLHEVRRAAHSRISDLEKLLDAARGQYDLATVAGLDVLHELHDELERQSSAMQSAVSGLARSLEEHDPGPIGDGDAPAPTSRENLIERHGIEAQFDALLDLFTMQGLYNPRSRTVQIQGRGQAPAKALPPFERIAELVLTESVCRYLARADSIHLVLTPLADVRVLKGIGKIIGFSDYTVVNAEDRGGAVKFVDRVTATDGQTVVDQLLDTTPIPGLAVALYAEDRVNQNEFIEGSGLPLDDSRDRVRAQAADAAAAGVVGRAMSPPEYMMLQALRQREGTPLLDESVSGAGTETWFPGHHLAGANGTLVSRKMGHSVRFRLDEVGRGAENRGYRMTYAPAA
jgi:hypothetical protein